MKENRIRQQWTLTKEDIRNNRLVILAMDPNLDYYIVEEKRDQMIPYRSSIQLAPGSQYEVKKSRLTSSSIRSFLVYEVIESDWVLCYESVGSDLRRAYLYSERPLEEILPIYPSDLMLKRLLRDHKEAHCSRYPIDRRRT